MKHENQIRRGFWNAFAIGELYFGHDPEPKWVIILGIWVMVLGFWVTILDYLFIKHI